MVIHVNQGQKLKDLVTAGMSQDGVPLSSPPSAPCEASLEVQRDLFSFLINATTQILQAIWCWNNT